MARQTQVSWKGHDVVMAITLLESWSVARCQMVSLADMMTQLQRLCSLHEVLCVMAWCYCHNCLLLHSDTYWFVDDDFDDCSALMDCGKLTAVQVLWLAHSRNRYGYNPLSKKELGFWAHWMLFAHHASQFRILKQMMNF